MFEKFGEMSSYTEINELAANLLQEGDIDSLKELAKENGIPDDYVEMYLEEAIPSLCDSTSAAIGKIDVECMELKPKELMLDWVEYIKGLCMENEMIAHQVRKKGKTLQGCMAVLLEYSFKNQITVDKALLGQTTWKEIRSVIPVSRKSSGSVKSRKTGTQRNGYPCKCRHEIQRKRLYHILPQQPLSGISGKIRSDKTGSRYRK